MMAVVLIVLMILLIIGGIYVLGHADQTWQIKKFMDNNAPSYMPEDWDMTNRRIGVGMISAALLLVFVIGFFR
jgi:cytochrome oxidase Cu insertion factor (SCO1/SenC/PrrC family)